MKQAHSEKIISDAEALLIESLAWGLLSAYSIKAPPVPVREMIQHPLPIFEHLSLLELNLGLYDAAYRLCLNGSRLIVVDPTKPHVIQRASMARELYVAFCHSSRAAELDWPHRQHPHIHSDLFVRCLLMPAAWVRTAYAADRSVENMVALFGVPPQMMAQRLSEIEYYPPRPSMSKSLTEALFSLKEPWRGRFLDLVANRATNNVWGKQLPTQEEVMAWLSKNPVLYKDVRYMLDAWQKPTLAPQEAHGQRFHAESQGLAVTPQIHASPVG